MLTHAQTGTQKSVDQLMYLFVFWLIIKIKHFERTAKNRKIKSRTGSDIDKAVYIVADLHNWMLILKKQN